MSRIPADLVLESGGTINGLRNESLNKPHALNWYEGGQCRGCHFLQGNVCTLHTYRGRSYIEGIQDRQGSIENTVQALVTRGDMPIEQKGRGDQMRYLVKCVRNFVTGTFVLPPKEVKVESRFYYDRRNAPWRRSG